MVTVIEPDLVPQPAVEPIGTSEGSRRPGVWLYRMPCAGVKYYYYYEFGPEIVPPDDLDLPASDAKAAVP